MARGVNGASHLINVTLARNTVGAYCVCLRQRNVTQAHAWRYQHRHDRIMDAPATRTTRTAHATFSTRAHVTFHTLPHLAACRLLPHRYLSPVLPTAQPPRVRACLHALTQRAGTRAGALQHGLADAHYRGMLHRADLISSSSSQQRNSRRGALLRVARKTALVFPAILFFHEHFPCFDASRASIRPSTAYFSVTLCTA